MQFILDIRSSKPKAYVDLVPKFSYAKTPLPLIRQDSQFQYDNLTLDAFNEYNLQSVPISWVDVLYRALM